MSNDDDWGPWIKHDGSGPPSISAPVRVQCVAPDGDSVDVVWDGYPGQSWFWRRTWWGKIEAEAKPIIRYRVRRPKELQLLRDIAASPPKELIREDA